MKFLPLVLVLVAAVPCGAQTPLAPAQLSDAANRVHRLQEGLKQVTVEQMDTDVPRAARDLITQLKDAVSRTADAVLALTGPAVDPMQLQNQMADLVKESPPNSAHRRQSPGLRGRMAIRATVGSTGILSSGSCPRAAKGPRPI